MAFQSFRASSATFSFLCPKRPSHCPNLGGHVSLSKSCCLCFLHLPRGLGARGRLS